MYKRLAPIHPFFTQYVKLFSHKKQVIQYIFSIDVYGTTKGTWEKLQNFFIPQEKKKKKLCV